MHDLAITELQEAARIRRIQSREMLVLNGSALEKIDHVIRSAKLTDDARTLEKAIAVLQQSQISNLKSDSRPLACLAGSSSAIPNLKSDSRPLACLAGSSSAIPNLKSDSRPLACLAGSSSQISNLKSDSRPSQISNLKSEIPETKGN